jgi:hypothetical protein
MKSQRPNQIAGIAILLVTISAMVAPVKADGQRFTRFEAPLTISQEMNSAAVATAIAPNMDQQSRWFIAREVKFLNQKLLVGDTFPKGTKLTVPCYKSLCQGSVCADIRNWHVAVMKGRLFGVSPGLLLGIRSEENPSSSRDWYAYGVVAQRGTSLWTQCHWSAKIVSGFAHRHGWDPMNPSYDDVASLSYFYVGHKSDEWMTNVWHHFKTAESVN